MTNISLSPNSQVFAKVQGTPPVFNLPATPAAPSVPAPDANTVNNLEKTPKTDTITIAGKTIKKKTAIIGGLGALATAAVIGAVVVFGKRKPPVVPPKITVPPETGAATEVTEVVETVTEAVTGKADEVVNNVQQEAQELADNLQKEVQELADSIQKDAKELADNVKKEAKDVIATVQKKMDELAGIFKNGGKDAEGKVVAEFVEHTENINGKDITHYVMAPKQDMGISKTTFYSDGRLRSAYIKNQDGGFIDYKQGSIIYFSEADRKSFRFDRNGLYRYASYPENSTVGVLDSLSFDSVGVSTYESFSGKYGELGGVTAYFDANGKAYGLSEGSNKVFTLVDGQWVDVK